MVLGVPVFILCIAVGIAVATGLAAISLVPAKSDVSKRMQQLEGMRWEQSTARTQVLERLFNEKQRTKLQQLLNEAGWYRVTPVQVIARSAAGAIFGFVLGLSLCAAVNSYDAIFLVALVILTVGTGYLPFSRLKAAKKKRQTDIQKALPDLLDILASTVQAGLGFNAALASAQDVVVGPLREEVRAVLSEIRLGRSRAAALKSMATRVRQEQLSTTVTAIVQAERLGSNLASVLEELAEEVRNRRMNRAEEIANLMPNKMVLPMAFFMLPALFVMVFGGIVAQYLTSPH